MVIRVFGRKMLARCEHLCRLGLWPDQVGSETQPTSVAAGGRVRKVGSLRRPRAGATVVEMALMLPLFILIVVGIIEFGRAFMVQQMVTNASREGARHATLPNTTENEVVAIVRDYLATGRINRDVVQVTVDPTNLQNAATGTQVSVEVRVPYSDVAWMPTPWFLGQTTLNSVTVMRHE
jgi:Flp pilus assembly protein TadG